MMKKINKYGSIALLTITVAVFTSCSDQFLEDKKLYGSFNGTTIYENYTFFSLIRWNRFNAGAKAGPDHFPRRTVAINRRNRKYYYLECKDRRPNHYCSVSPFCHAGERRNLGTECPHTENKQTNCRQHHHSPFL